jgi:hypothetical protein
MAIAPKLRLAGPGEGGRLFMHGVLLHCLTVRPSRHTQLDALNSHDEVILVNINCMSVGD